MSTPQYPLTVLMAVHNGGRYLSIAIDSILAQTYKTFHFLIVDDASNDETRPIIQSYEDPRIELVCLERNVGQTAALNVGLRRISSSWIARMDADDYAAPERFAQQMACLEKRTDVECLGTFGWLFREDPNQMDRVLEKPLEHGDILQTLWSGIPMIHGSLIVSRRAMVETGLYDERYRYSADLDLYTRLLPRCRAENLPVPLLGIRRHQEQGSLSKRCIDENVEIFSRMLHQTRTRKEHLRVRESLAFTYRTRATYWQSQNNRLEAIKDLGRSCLAAPERMLNGFIGRSVTST